ncbi:DUF1598 domain-containing protein [Planctomicrobium sp. SH661]|uniref:DUF1598 domain-containing protein n=1 Tax=Planctomicrobium sp. SH661 TaxID=3448124 RepID=UPI003F5C9579
MVLKVPTRHSARSKQRSRKSLWLGLLGGAALFSSSNAVTVLAAEAVVADVAKDVEGLLNSGEFGAAADLAGTATGITRDQLMERVIFSQIGAGESAETKAVLQQLSNDQARVSAAGQIARKQMTSGGADFTELIYLIQNEVEGPWFDVDGEGGTMTPFTSGIKVDPNGILTRELREDRTGRLTNVEQQARVAALNEDMASPSTLRLVSLTRLEKEVARRLDEGKPVVESMKYLAGLSQVQYIFVYPEQGEIVIGGPAAGWSYDGRGMPVSQSSGRPSLQLEDLVTVLRTFSPAGQAVFGCSIDPQQENLKKVMEYVSESQSKGPLSPAGVRSWSNKIGNILGAQDITVFGVPGNSRIARVMVEADYRMKLIGIGKLEGGSQIPDYFELLAKDPALASGSLDALRWWMTMQYESVQHSPDLTAFEIRGSGVKCLSENQFLTANGERVATGKAEPVNQKFAANFTKHYQELAAKDPVFADLQGIFDLALVAAVVQQNQLDQRANWDRGAFAANGEYQPLAYATPKQTDSVVNHHVYNGKDVVLQVAGGVRADLASIAKDPSLNQESPQVGTVAQSARAPELPIGRWWWDAK